MVTTTEQTERSRAKAERRDQLLRTAARLFAESDFNAVSVEELGTAAGVTGPAVYRHFGSKVDVLADLLVGVSRRLLEGGSRVMTGAGSDPEALSGLVAFHTRFALDEPELIRIQDRNLNSLGAPERQLVRRLQRSYVEIWVAVLAGVDPSLPVSLARTKVHATLGLLNSTPHSAGNGRHRDITGPLLEEMALAALTVPFRMPSVTGGSTS